MNLTTEDELLLRELCYQYSVSYDKVIKLLKTVYDSDSKDRAHGIYDTLREIIKSKSGQPLP